MGWVIKAKFCLGLCFICRRIRASERLQAFSRLEFKVYLWFYLLTHLHFPLDSKFVECIAKQKWRLVVACALAEPQRLWGQLLECESRVMWLHCLEVIWFQVLTVREHCFPLGWLYTEHSPWNTSSPTNHTLSACNDFWLKHMPRLEKPLQLIFLSFSLQRSQSILLPIFYFFSRYHSISKAKSVLIGSRGLWEALCQRWWGSWLVQRHRQPTDPC